MDRIYLIPGFFGFANLGELRYFGHVADYLTRVASDPLAVHVVPTRPTASIPMRAVALHAMLAQTVQRGDRVFLVGHSSGGLDARLWASPGVNLPDGADPSPLADPLRAIVSVSTPHHGTPSAEVFTTAAGKRLLRVLSIMTILVVRKGGAPLRALLQVGDVFRSAESTLSTGSGVLDEVFDGLLSELSADKRAEVEAFFRGVGEDQGLLPQLIPDAMEMFDASTRNRDGVRYGSVVSRARPPGLKGMVASGMSPRGQAAFAMYRLCWRMASRLDAAPRVDPTLLAQLTARWPDIRIADNDGMVPTLSQPHGELIRAVDADHLDVLGHFGDATLEPPSYDWFNTGSGFTREHFELLWGDVAHFLEEAR